MWLDVVGAELVDVIFSVVVVVMHDFFMNEVGFGGGDVIVEDSGCDVGCFFCGEVN